MSDRILPLTNRTSLITRAALVAFCLAAGFAYRASVSLIAIGIVEDVFLVALAALLLLVAILMRGSQTLGRYWQLPFAFFVFTVAGFLGDVGISPLQQWFARAVLHETPTAANPLASTVTGTVLVQLFSTLCLVAPIVLLTLASRSSLGSIFVAPSRDRWMLLLGLIGLVVFYLVAALGLSRGFFPNSGVTPSRFLALTPTLLLLVLANGLREELWFRGLFLGKYQGFLSPLSANLLAAVIFTSFHVQVQYSRSLPIFLGIALVEGLILGYMMQRSKSVLAPALLHAGTDIPIFLVYLLSAST